MRVPSKAGVSGDVRRRGRLTSLNLIHTFSIVACDLEEPAWGVAVASKFLAAGSVVSWAQAGVGAIATQALARVSYGPDGLALLASGRPAEETLEVLLSGDPDPGAPHRQVGIVDAQGRSAAYTGPECLDWAGHLTGPRFACQGNILTGPETLEAMAEAFEGTSGELADRLITALLAGDQAGGDRRGKQAAGLLVVRPGGGYGGDNDRYLDLRVDDHPEPVRELRKLVASHHVFFGDPDREAALPIEPGIARELQAMAQQAGYYDGEIDGVWDVDSQKAFWMLVGDENLEERWRPDGHPDKIDPVALDYLRSRFSG